MDDVLRTIQAGDIGAYITVVDKLASIAARRIPKADGTDWAPGDVEDLISSFYVSAAYQHALLNAHDDQSLRKLVYTALANLARADLRRTDRGRLHRRLSELLSAGEFVEHPKKFWRRATDPTEATTAVQSELLEAAWKIEVSVVRWRPDAKRNSPVAERSSFLKALNAIYDCAAGAVHIDVLVEVLGQRLGVGPVTVTEELDSADDQYAIDVAQGPAERLLDQENELDAAVHALELWGQLSQREQELVPHLSGSARQAAEAVGRGKSAVNEAMNRLKEKFRVVLGEADEDHCRRVVQELLALSEHSLDS